MRNMNVITISVTRPAPSEYFPGECSAVPVGGEPVRDVESRLTARDKIQNSRGDDPAEDLRNNIMRELRRLESSSRGKPDRYRGVQVAPRDVADRECHRKHRKTECQGNSQEADSTPGKAAASTALPQPPSTSQNVPINSAVARLVSDMGLSSF